MADHLYIFLMFSPKPVLANHIDFLIETQTKESIVLSVHTTPTIGFSHKHAEDFTKFHQANPSKPLLATECCSCLSQRGEDYDTCDKPRPSR